MKTRIYTLLAALLLTVASVQAQTVTTISVDVVNPSLTVGDDVRVGVTLDAEINAIATLTVTNSDNSYNETFNVALVGGNGSSYGRFTVPNLAVGTYSITASFAGNNQYAASTSVANTLQVNKVTTALSLTLIDAAIYVGEYTYFNVVLQNPNKLDANNSPKQISINAVATVRLTDKETFDDATDKVYTVGLVNGTAGGYQEEDGNLSPRDYQLALTDLPAGTYKLKAFYEGNDKYTGSESDVVTLTVNKIATNLTLTGITDITTGQDAVITVTAEPTDQNVAAAVNTIATVTVGDTPYKVAIVNGTGTCYIPNLTAGTYEVTASIGDDKYADSNSGTAKTLTVNEGNPIVESNAVATVTVTPAINTIAQVTVGNATYYVPVVNGTGTLTLPQQVAGTYNVQAKFIEDGQYAAAKSATQQLVSVPGVTLPFATGQVWATWCDDWAWKKPAGVTAYTISAVSGNTVTITAVEDENIPAYTPLLLRKTGDAVTPTKVIPSTEPTGYNGIVSTAGTGATLWGNATDAAITEGGFTADGLTAYSLYNGRFYRYEGTQSIAANRCLLTLTPVYSAPMLNIEIGETTNLVSIDNGQLTIDNDVWYTLDGRKLNGKPTKKGLYIHNGRKVVIK